MKLKRYSTGVTFFTTPEMYFTIKHISDEKEISLSELLRDIIEKALMEKEQELLNNELILKEGS